ncbi:ribosome maturation factor RimM [Gallibacter intestinalis]|uniref:Ribosome maturation factor RimM n=1 Tax=Gallibacter intestinalis TaxID=2779356 RepID=A0ABR9QVM6_9FIRM|nr:ribosome maturation factor RimM [Gallibacter intestinalis]MBE5034928.1 16S rRNA processing protein RimM [Gallibacter intestinalis]
MDKIVIGKIVNVVGLKGEVKVYSYAEEPDRFERLEKIFLGTEEKNTEYAVTKVRYKGDMVILTLDGVTDRNAAEALKGLMVLMDEADLEELPEGVYYIKDLIGMKVVSDSGVELGTLKDINTNTAQRVYEVARPGKPDILIPGVDEFILDTDMDNRVITVKVIEGLYED